MTGTDDGDERHAVIGRLTGDGTIDVAAWSPPPAPAASAPTIPSARLAIRIIERGVVAVLAVADEPIGYDLAVDRLADGADLSVVAGELWAPGGDTLPLGVVTARIEEGTVRLAVAGSAIAARLEGPRRRCRGLAGASAERSVRAVTAAFDDDATIVIQAGAAAIPTLTRSDASATCDRYAASLLGRLGWTGHAVLVARPSGSRC